MFNESRYSGKTDYKSVPEEPGLASKGGCQIWTTAKLIGEKLLRILHELHWRPMRSSTSGSRNNRS